MDSSIPGLAAQPTARTHARRRGASPLAARRGGRLLILAGLLLAGCFEQPSSKSPPRATNWMVESGAKLAYAIVRQEVDTVRETVTPDLARLRLDRFQTDGNLSISGSSISGPTMLHLAVSVGSTEIAGILLAQGADIDAMAYNVDTIDLLHSPLHAAAYRGDTRMVRFLLEQGANPELHTSTGHTPLALATVGNRVEVVQALLDHGVDPSPVSSDGATPLDIAIQYFLPEIKALLERKGAVAGSGEPMRLPFAAKPGSRP